MDNVVIEAKELAKWFEIRRSPLATLYRRERQYVKAVNNVSFKIARGGVLGLVGESGCGKTTTGRLLSNLVKPTKGQIIFEGKDIHKIADAEAAKQMRRKIQMIFQDPYEYLSPWLSVGEILAEPLRLNNLAPDQTVEQERVESTMEFVGLTPVSSIIRKHPQELSGGQRQRVMIARALMLQPKFIVADEPVSMIDVSIRLGIMNLLLDLVQKFDLSMVFITHDIACARYMCDRIAVMYLGRIVEKGPTDDVIKSSKHPYTKALMSAVPIADPNIKVPEIPLKRRIQTTLDLPSGCSFHPRCPHAQEICKAKEPELREVGKDHLTACHLYEKI